MYIIRLRQRTKCTIHFFRHFKSLRSSVPLGITVGIRGNLAVSLQNYLQNSKQAFVIKDKKSEYKILPSGVCVRSLAIFHSYMNDISKIYWICYKTFSWCHSHWKIPTGEQLFENTGLEKKRKYIKIAGLNNRKLV